MIRCMEERLALCLSMTVSPSMAGFAGQAALVSCSYGLWDELCEERKADEFGSLRV